MKNFGDMFERLFKRVFTGFAVTSSLYVIYACFSFNDIIGMVKMWTSVPTVDRQNKRIILMLQELPTH